MESLMQILLHLSISTAKRSCQETKGLKAKITTIIRNDTQFKFKLNKHSWFSRTSVAMKTGKAIVLQQLLEYIYN